MANKQQDYLLEIRACLEELRPVHPQRTLVQESEGVCLEHQLAILFSEHLKHPPSLMQVGYLIRLVNNLSSLRRQEEYLEILAKLNSRSQHLDKVLVLNQQIHSLQIKLLQQLHSHQYSLD